MAMLAERKQKTKWVINPTKKPLWKTNEEGGVKFGMQLMEKMGWTPGKGLGLHEQGVAEPIRLGYKGDTKGMGFKDADDDWIQHQDEFNSLLNSLANGKTNERINTEEDATKNSVKSLEEKSKNSRARVHYQKFTRGKDLSRYSEHDLACILGNRKKKLKEQKSEEEKEESKAQADEDTENSFGVTTINSGSIADYFRKKLAKAHKHLASQENNESGDFEEEPQSEALDLDLKKKSESKKEKKKIQDLIGNLGSNEEVADEKMMDEDKSRTRKKKKKRKESKESEVKNTLVSEDDQSPPAEETCENVEPEQFYENNTLLSDCKKKKRKREVEVENEESTQLSKKEKKKKRLQEEPQEEFLEPSNQPSNPDEASEEPQKKKKKKKRKTSEAVDGKPEQKPDDPTTDVNILKQDPAHFTDVQQNVHQSKDKAPKKEIGRNKIFDLICDAQIDKFKNSNLEDITGYGLVNIKPKR